MSDRLVGFAVGKAQSYLCLEKKIDTLERSINVLKNRAADVNVSVEEAKLSSGKKRKREVEEWLKEVEKTIDEFDFLKVDFQSSNFYSRIQLAKRADKMIIEVAELTSEGEFSGGILLDVHEKKGLPLVAVKGKGRAFNENLKEIRKWIINDEISIIGIYGMGGVGKTTLATHVHNNLLNEVQFGHVYWVTVSQETSSICQLQNKIAKALHVVLPDEDDEIKRAAKIFNVLKERDKAKFVLILDDMWAPFDLVRIGIPLEEVESKLIITSRSLDVCNRIGCQEKIKVKNLGGEEAWLLFLEKLGRCTELPPDLEEIAKSMAKKCGGLPLGIITIAGSMRGVDDIYEWRNALEELKEASDRGPNDEVYQVLVYSFNRLRDQRLKNCFLYCCLYPEDHLMPRDDLIRMFIVEGLIEKRNSRHKEVEQGHEILNRLENVCLLEKTTIHTNVMGVKMHDLVRDMGKKLTKVNPKYMVKVGIGLEQIPDASEWEEDLDKVSLMWHKTSLIPIGTSPKCLRLSTLIFTNNFCLLRIPNSFFDQLCGLKVLDLSENTRLEELPNCISKLENLTALLLNSCHALRFVPNLGELKALRELDMFDTAIEDVPEGLEKLTKLKCLIIAFRNLKMMPVGLLSKLTSLQILKFAGKLMRVQDLEAMQQLEQYKGCFPDVHSFSQFVSLHEHHKRPWFYVIHVGRIECLYNFIPPMSFLSREKTDKRVTLSHIRIGENGIGFPEDMQRLTIRECTGLGGCLADAFSIWNITKRGLKEWEIWGNEEIQCITKLSSPSAPLQSVEHMSLYKLPNLVGLCEWESLAVGNHLQHGAFSCLSFLNIGDCGKITKIFTPKMLQHLQNLVEIIIDGCDVLEEMIAEDEECSRAATISLPKLKVLNLSCMRHLRSIWNGTIICNFIESIAVRKCPSQERLPLLLPSPPPALQYIELCPRELMESLERDHALEPFVRMLGD